MNFGMLAISASLAFAAIGSALGMGKAGMATVGAWKKCFAQNKKAPFLLTIFVGAPLSQTIYGFLLMNRLRGALALDPWFLLGIGIFGGIAIGCSAFFQGKAGAAAADAFAESEKGFGAYITVVGLIETVAIFVMIFLMLTINQALQPV